MKRSEIERRINFVQQKLAEARDPQTLASLNRTLERLIMMEAEDDPKPEDSRAPDRSE